MSFMSKTRSTRTRTKNKSLSTWNQHLIKHGGDIGTARCTPFTPPDFDTQEKERAKLYQMDRVSSYTGKGKPLADYVSTIVTPSCTCNYTYPRMTLIRVGLLNKSLFDKPTSNAYLKDPDIPYLVFKCNLCKDVKYKAYIEELYPKRFVYNSNNRPTRKRPLSWALLYSPSSSTVRPDTVANRCPQCRASKELLCECHFTDNKVTNIPLELRSVPDLSQPKVPSELIKWVQDTVTPTRQRGRRLVNTKYANCLPQVTNYARRLSNREWLRTKAYDLGYQQRPANWFGGK